ncbi:12470_t:CDS:1 [Ambispora leptoticha]|uniref:1-acyl-sn-glycerol-3-phosphate acyltransferase n=1 Tax=Ambispora leptoticha TaxID=144679 RepID=A0A9N9FHA3_9GLOM|nr:12470_t:CDS:1 [Ambispora leptoticha]
MESETPILQPTKVLSSRSVALYTLIVGGVIIGSRYHPKLQFIVRAFLSLVCLLFFSAYGSILAVIFTILGRRDEINWATARSYVAVAAPLVGITFKVENEHYMDNRPVIFVCNHQAAIDMMILGRIFPKSCVVVGKSELKYVPLLGSFMHLSGAIFLDRANHGNAVKTFSEAVKDIKKRNVSVWIFPEGTRGHLQEANLLPFKKGAFHLAVQAQIPIVPVVVSNYSDIYDSKRKIFRGGELKIKVLPPIPTAGLDQENREHIDELTTRTRQIMLDTLKSITSSPLENGHTKEK